MLYAIGTAPSKLLVIKEYDTFSESGEYFIYINILYDIVQSECTLFNNKCDAEKILDYMKDKNNMVAFKNGNIFSGILDELDEPEPKIEDLKICRLNIEEVE